jgi:uncharacterized membrane protein
MQEYIVVTLLVAATGKLELPKIQSQEQLVTALNRLAALRQDQVRYIFLPLLFSFHFHFDLPVHTRMIRRHRP